MEGGEVDSQQVGEVRGLDFFSNAIPIADLISKLGLLLQRDCKVSKSVIDHGEGEANGSATYKLEVKSDFLR